MVDTQTSTQRTNTKKNAWSWIPTLYFAEGLPYIIVITVAVIMYKRLGISNAEIALYTSWLYLPWVIKPLWSPLVDILRTKRFWITAMQFFIGAGMASAAFTIPMPEFFQLTLLFFWLIAFASATHDIAADGFYMLGLSEGMQSFFVGIRSTFYRIAMITGQGLLVILAGYLESALTVHPTEFKVAAEPNIIFENTIETDSLFTTPLEGALRLIANPSNIEISTKPKLRKVVSSDVNSVRKFNLKNGFSGETTLLSDTSNQTDLVGNIGIVKFRLSQKPDEGKEYKVNLDFIEGNEGIKVIEGKTLLFNSNNWNKSAYAVVQLDTTIKNRTAALFKARSDRVPLAWAFTFAAVAFLFFFFFVYHKFVLPRPVADKTIEREKNVSVFNPFFKSFYKFFKKEKIILIVSFLLLYRLGEAQLVKMAPPFMLDTKEVGGLGLTTTDVGFIYGTIGMIALIIGGILGGLSVSKKGLKFWLWPMLLAINVPNLLYVYLSFAQPSSIWIIYACVALEQFGYGFGFTFYMMYMIYISNGEFKASHYAIATGFMALGMMIPGMFSGIIQEAVGYRFFFVWVVIATVPSFLIAKFIPIEYSFGMKNNSEA